MARKNFREELREVVFAKIDNVLAKPRTSAHSPQALAEVVYSLMNLIYDDRRYERWMNNEYPGSRPWYFDDNIDSPMAVTKLQKMVDRFREE